jgi:nitrate/nitrite transporter NarK
MKLSDLTRSGHWPTLLAAFLYLDYSFIVWTVLGGIGGFYLASSLGFSEGLTASYVPGLLIFAGLCFLAILGLGVVKNRWRSAWGALAGVRILDFYAGYFELDFYPITTNEHRSRSS